MKFFSLTILLDCSYLMVSWFSQTLKFEKLIKKNQENLKYFSLTGFGIFKSFVDFDWWSFSENDGYRISVENK